MNKPSDRGEVSLCVPTEELVQGLAPLFLNDDESALDKDLVSKDAMAAAMDGIFAADNPFQS